MEFKINSKTRIKIPHRILGRFRNEDGSYINIRKFGTEVGLKYTSKRYIRSKYDTIYYFQVLDKNKYFLDKIKYGII